MQQSLDNPVLDFAGSLCGGKINFTLEPGNTDQYQFKIEADGSLDVKAGTERGALYAVYDALAGKTCGAESPEFSIRGLNPCESLNRHTPEQLETLIDRMGRWRMNTIIIHSNYGFIQKRELIERECAKRGIELVHYTYSNLCFINGIDPKHFAKDADGRPRWKHAECETRLCGADSIGMQQYRQNIAAYLKQHPDYRRLLFATADGTRLCQCPECRDLNAIKQWQKIFQPFIEETEGKCLREALIYQQRYSLAPNMDEVNQLDRIVFDTHLRYGRTPLGTPHRWMRQGLRFCYPPDGDPLQDPRGDQPINVYLWERIKEWREAFKGQFYVFENLMIQGIWGCPRPNTNVYLEDLRNFKRIGMDGVVYEAFEPGIMPFLPTFDAIAATMWNINAPYTPTDFEAIYCDAEDENFWHLFPGSPHWTGKRGGYPREELAIMLYKFHALQPASFVPGSGTGTGNDRELIDVCRDILDLVVDQDGYDWIYIACTVLRKLYQLKEISPQSEPEKDLLCTKKLWDFQERHVPSRETTTDIIKRLYSRL